MSPVPEPAENHQNSIDDFEIGNHVINIIAPGSSSEEEDTFNENGGYQPLSQGPDMEEEDEEEAIDYSSLSGILSALNTHGPNIVSETESQEGESSNNNSSEEKSVCVNSDQLSEGSLLRPSEKTLSVDSEAENVYAKEQALIWNSTKKSNEIQIDETKENEIKSLMSRITLPNSAIPPWAKEISDEEWKSQISSRIFGSELTKKDQS